MRFTYSSGQRPLDGYTIKRGIGRGGFGEVYYGVSDGGKEVALKLVRGGNQDVELRGMAQCLNLKHPNLVSLYDLRTDIQGDHWVIMEYISGEPLNLVLNRHPRGLSPELVQQWFLALAKAVGYLHDHGIVHRDLKPGNIFLENGSLKIGDYGLSKFISGSQRTAQTQSVGTVHYMAPEISTGNYNKQIDVYAAGIILYEMLTGHVPFEGESAGEILMKHLTAPPDLTRLPAEYVPIVGRALAKNPAHRYATMAEMARAVEGLGKDPSRLAEPARLGKSPVSVPRPALAEPVLTVLPAVSLRGQVAELCGSLALAALFAAMAATVLATRMRELTLIGSCFFLTLLISWAVLVPAKFWSQQRGASWVRRLTMTGLGMLVGLSALWLDGWVPALAPAELASGEALTPEPARAQSLVSAFHLPAAAGYVTFFGLSFFALRWWKMADRHRSQWFSFAPLLAAGFWGCLLYLVCPAEIEMWRGLIALILASAIIQLVSPWEQPPPRSVKRMRLRYA